MRLKFDKACKSLEYYSCIFLSLANLRTAKERTDSTLIVDFFYLVILQLQHRMVRSTFTHTENDIVSLAKKQQGIWHQHMWINDIVVGNFCIGRRYTVYKDVYVESVFFVQTT